MKRTIVMLMFISALSCKKQDNSCHTWYFENYCVDKNGQKLGSSDFGTDKFCYDAGVSEGSVISAGSGTDGVECFKKYIKEVR
jgi:hypothetical protein